MLARNCEAELPLMRRRWCISHTLRSSLGSQRSCTRPASSLKPPMMSLSPVEAKPVPGAGAILSIQSERFWVNKEIRPNSLPSLPSLKGPLRAASAFTVPRLPPMTLRKPSRSAVGRRESNLMMPAVVLRPNRVPWGPRMTSTSSKSNRGKDLKVTNSTGTSSKTMDTGWEAAWSKSALPKPRM